MYAIYYMWRPNEAGYIGQDSNFEIDNPTRIKDHFINLRDNKKKDSAASLVRKYGVGGLMYGYYDVGNNFGLGQNFFNQMASDIGVKEFSEEQQMHIAEIMHINARREINEDMSLSEVNKAIGGGGLSIDFSNTSAIQQLIQLQEKYKLKFDKHSWYKAGIVNISDVVDWITKPNALHKIYYPKQYAILRFIGMLFESFLIQKAIPKTITKTFRQMIVDKINNTDSNTFITILKDYINNFLLEVNNIIREDRNSSVGLSADWLFPDEKIEDIAEFIKDQVFISITKTIANSGNKNLSKDIHDNYQTKHQNQTKWHNIVYIKHNDILQAMGLHLNTIPSWFTDGVKLINSEQVPPKRIDDNVMKKVAFDVFWTAAFKRSTEQSRSWARPYQNTSWVYIDKNEYGYLKDRMLVLYREWFDDTATVIQYWNDFYRRVAATQADSYANYEDQGITVINNQYVYSLWHADLINIFRKYSAQDSVDAVPFMYF